jgi:pimeloyl-ACP methyl ester carboxylesterase
VAERRGEVDGLEVFWHEEPAEETPVVYLHGVPTDADDWLPFLARTGGLAPDLPGFGRSAKPGNFDYSIAGYDRFLEAFLAACGVDRFSLVVHDWGAVGLALAQRFPERVERLVIIDCVPLLPGYRWHWIARMWRRPLVGELTMGFTSRRTMQFLARRGPIEEFPPDVLDRVLSRLDHGTQRAILRLYRSAPPDVLAAAGRDLGRIEAPALVLWGEDDPYIPTRFAEAYAAALPNAEIELVAGAGHWPWVQRPDLTARVAGHLR